MQATAAAPSLRMAPCSTAAQPRAALRAAPFAAVSSKNVQQRRRAAQLFQAPAAATAASRRAVRVAAAAGEIPPDFQQRKERLDAGHEDYSALTLKIEEVAQEVAEGLSGTSLFLIGMMGSGKSTVGKLVSKALGYCFFDTDSLIEQLTQQKVSEIFAGDGEDAFRQMETQVLAELAPFKNCVVATGGGVPTRAENWGHMQGGVTVWLNGPPALLAHRVVGDGTESRPLLSQSTDSEASSSSSDGSSEGSEAGSSASPDEYQAAVARLTALLEQRQALYQSADITVSLEGSGPEKDLGAPAMMVAYRVLAALNQRIKDDAEERRRRMDFEIVQEEGLPETMRVMESPAAAAQQQQQEQDPFLP